MKCPVCKKKIKDIVEDYMEDHTLMERYARCVDDEKLHYYTYHYHVGSTEEIIGGVTFYSHYADDDRSKILQAEQYNKALDLEREFYEEINGTAWERAVQRIKDWVNKV